MKHATPILTTLFFTISAVAGFHLATTQADDAGGAAFFNDVEHQAYYNAPAAAMARKGIVKGYDDGRFGPNDPVTRGQVVTMLHRYDQSVVQPLRDQIAKLRDMMNLGRCGDGQKQIGEQCDDGNVISGDGCSSECLKEFKPKPVPVTCPGGYKVGEEVPSIDSCNVCGCTEGGVIACTSQVCVDAPIECPEDAKVCPDGSTVIRNSNLNCEFNPCPEGLSCKDKEQELADLIRSRRACRTDNDCSVLVRTCSPFLTCGKPVSTGALGDVKVAIANYIKECPENTPGECADCAHRGAVCERGFCRLDPPATPKCGDGVCEEGEVDSCSEDCISPAKKCEIYRRGDSQEEVCAICGDGRCDAYEECTSSDCTDMGCTDDCGPLYCPEDCE